MDSPLPFLDRCEQVGISLPAPVVLATDRWAAVDRAIRAVDVDPLDAVDFAALTPSQARRLVDRVITAQIKADRVHSAATVRLRTLAMGEVVRAVRAHAEAIILALQPIHDRLADQLADVSRLLRGVTDATLASAAPDVRAAWISRPDLDHRMRDIRAVRATLADVGYQVDTRDQLGRQLERLTRFIDVPADIDPAQMAAWFGHAENGAHDAVLADGGRLWLPTVDQQRDRVERLRHTWTNRRRPPA